MQSLQSLLLRRAVATGNRVRVPQAARLGLGTLLRETATQAKKDRITMLAGNLAYRTTFAVFPTLIAGLWALTALHATRVIDRLVAVLETVMPHAAADALKQQLTSAPSNRASGALTIGALVSTVLAIWTILAVFQAASESLNVIYGVRERRPLLRRYGVFCLLALSVGALLIAALALAVGGAALTKTVSERVGLGAGFQIGWALATWLALLLLVFAAMALVYYFAPSVEQRVRWVGIGTAVGSVLWLLFTAGFSLYINQFASPFETYGALAGVAVLMIYCYGTSCVLLIGAELNQISEAHHPRGKNSGQQRPSG